MRFKILAALSIASLTFSTGSSADNISFNLKNRAFALEYSHLPQEANATFAAELLHHSDNGDLISGRFRIEQSLYDVNTNLKAGIGARALYVDVDSREGAAIALSGSLSYTFPENTKFSVAANLDYAPSVVSFFDMEEFYESKVTASYQLINHANAYIGARYVRTKFTQFNARPFDSGMFFGISIDL